MKSSIKPKLLVIPHIYSEGIKVRGIEFAKRLTPYFEVYCLSWHDLYEIDDKYLIIRWLKKIYIWLSSLLSKISLIKKNEINYIKAPYLQQILLDKLLGIHLSSYIVKSFNKFILTLLIKKFNIDIIFASTTAFYFPKVNNVKVFYDLFDWFSEGTVSQEVLNDIRSYFSYIKLNTEKIFVISSPLQEKLKLEFDLKSEVLPNGADIKQLRSVKQEEITLLRKKWGLIDRYVIGYIGNHGPFTGIDFVLSMFNVLKLSMKDAVLFVVGPVDQHWQRNIDFKNLSNVIFTGQVPPEEVGIYFNSIDLGLLAQEKSPGTELAFQIKMVEYTACRKFVISTPLEVWKRLNWPNVILEELEPKKWAKAIEKVRGLKWQDEWDKVVEPYDWKVLSFQLSNFLKDTIT